MKSEEGDKYLGEHLNNINTLLEQGHDPKVKDLVKYEDAKTLSDISYTEGYNSGIEFERNKENYDTWMVNFFRKISVDGLPKINRHNHSKMCVCFVPSSNPFSSIDTDKYVLGYYDYKKKGWITCSCCGGTECFKPTHYLELPDAHKMKKEFDTTGQTRSTNCFKEIPDGVYSGKFGGHVGMIEYQGKVYNYTFLKGIVQENIPKTITVVDGYGWTLLKDGPIVPTV